MAWQQDLTRRLAEKYRVRISPEVRHLAETLPPKAAARLALQFYPSELELEPADYYTEDPLHEEDSDIHPLPDIIHKYPNKILYLTTSECPVFCRYCTRKRKTLKRQPILGQSLEAATAYVQAHPAINEVIFSGGDPFMLPDRTLLHIAQSFARIPQVRYLRWHTRTLTTLPKRWRPSLFKTLAKLFQEDIDLFFLVTHINTAEEITDETLRIAAQLRQQGFTLLNQAVLLKGVNDDAILLKELMLKLSAGGITPYYLHQLDRVEGASHFEVPVERGREIFYQLKQSLPIALLPRYVRDSKQGKVNLAY